MEDRLAIKEQATIINKYNQHSIGKTKQQLSSFFHKHKALPKCINVVSTNYGDPTLIEKKQN